MYKLTAKEVILNDDYPMYAGYVYIVDNRFTRSNTIGTVGAYKEQFGAKEIRRCDLFEHPGARVGDMVYSKYYVI